MDIMAAKNFVPDLEDLDSLFSMEDLSDMEGQTPAIIEKRSVTVSPKREIAEPVKEVELDPKASEDFEMARNNIKRVMATGESTLQGITELAEAGDSARAYEVAGQIMKILLDANKDLIAIHKTKKEIAVTKTVKEEAAEKNNPQVINNTTQQAFFCGTTEELSQFLKNSINIPQTQPAIEVTPTPTNSVVDDDDEI